MNFVYVSKKNYFCMHLYADVLSSSSEEYRTK